MVTILKCDRLDFSNITIEKPEKVGKFFYSKITYDEEPLYIQTHKLNNLKSMESFDSKDPYIELEATDSMYDIMSQLDQTILESTNENWETWMNKKIPLDVFKAMYQPITTPPKAGDYPQLKLKLPVNRSKLLTKVFDENKVDQPIEQLLDGYSVICIYNIKGIKYNEKTFRCDAYVTQIKLFKHPVKSHEIPKECLIDSDDEPSIDENDIIDPRELEELLKQDKLKMLYSQKREELRLIEQIQSRIQNLDQEIQELT
jgi:hypothetical protein